MATAALGGFFAFTAPVFLVAAHANPNIGKNPVICFGESNQKQSPKNKSLFFLLRLYYIVLYYTFKNNPKPNFGVKYSRGIEQSEIPPIFSQALVKALPLSSSPVKDTGLSELFLLEKEKPRKKKIWPSAINKKTAKGSQRHGFKSR